MKYIHTIVFGVVASVVTIALAGTTMAHVTVQPAQVPTATFQTFTVSVPNEKDVPTNSIKVVIPSGVAHVTPTQKAGWSVAVDGNNDVVNAITWSGGIINKGLRDEFTFSAQTPEKQTSLHWKAYQTYADGTVVSWDKKENSSGHDSSKPNEGPFSVTEVTAESEKTTDEKSADKTEKAASRALYIAIIALGLSIISLVLATRKKS